MVALEEVADGAGAAQEAPCAGAGAEAQVPLDKEEQDAPATLEDKVARMKEQKVRVRVCGAAGTSPNVAASFAAADARRPLSFLRVCCGRVCCGRACACARRATRRSRSGNRARTRAMPRLSSQRASGKGRDRARPEPTAHSARVCGCGGARARGEAQETLVLIGPASA